VQPTDRVLPESPDHPAESQKERDRTITQGCNPSPDSLAETGRKAALPDAGGDRDDDGENPADGQHRADPGVAADGFGCRPLGRHLTDGIRRTGPSGWAVELFRGPGRAAVDSAALLLPFPNHRTARGPLRMRAVRQIPDLAVHRARKPGRSAVFVKRFHDGKKSPVSENEKLFDRRNLLSTRGKLNLTLIK